jgi:FixJ family two-component response regulator
MIAIVDDDEAVRMATERLSGALGLIVPFFATRKQASA